MTPLRQRMLDAMTVRGLAERTKECYTDAVARLARHNMVYLPRINSSPCACFVARQINADC